MAETYVPPTPDEMSRVARHWQRVRELACDHPELTFGTDMMPTCGKCHRPIRMMSDIQIDAVRQVSSGNENRSKE